MLMRMPSAVPVGSGKFRTPRERMHDANLIPAAASVEALLLVLLGLAEDPQPVIDSTPDTTATTTAIGRRYGTDTPARCT